MIKRNTIIAVAFLAAVVCGSILSTGQVFAETECAGAKTSVIVCGGATGQAAIIEIVKMIVKIMTAGVGVLAVGAVIFGAILYTTSEGSPDKLSKARTVWINTIIGLLLFAFMVAITNFFVPGGIF